MSDALLDELMREISDHGDNYVLDNENDEVEHFINAQTYCSTSVWRKYAI